MPIDYTPLMGGLDQASAPLAIQPGRLLGCINFEIDRTGRGYRYPEGYERFDGNTSPSSATFQRINFDTGSAIISDGDTVSGSVSGASGVAIIDGVLKSGTYAGGDAAGYIVLTTVSGTFVDTDNLMVSAVKRGEIESSGVQVAGSGAPDTSTESTWKAECVAIARANIDEVQGTGNILGVHRYKSVLYAFRNNAGDTATDMYKSTISGWSKVDLGNKLSFTAGTAVFTASETVTGGTSGATATIQRVVVESGSWSSGDAAGFLTIGTVTGGPFQAEGITDGAATPGSATCSGAEVENVITKDGRFEVINHNFGGHSSTQKMFGVNGVGNAFEYDGTAFSFISTGMDTDAPTHIRAHQGHLFLSFVGGSVQHSSLVSSPLTAPFVWSAITGAAELTVGDEVTGMENIAGESLALFAKNLTKILYGSSSADWNMQDHSDTAGAIEWTIQSLSEPFYVDSKKVTSLRATKTYGGFGIAELSGDLQEFISLKSGKEIASVVSLDKTQYRVLYNDGYFASMSLVDGGIAGFMIGEYPDVPTCACNDEDSGRMFFGCDDGFVYEMDKGTSFDGEDITAFIKVPFNFFKNPRMFKRFYKAIFELGTGANVVAFNFFPDFDYMQANIPTAETSSIAIQAGSMTWDVDNWDTYNWASDSDDNEQPEAYINGIASEMGLVIYVTSATQEPFTINGIMIEYDIKGNKR